MLPPLQMRREVIDVMRESDNHRIQTPVRQHGLQTSLSFTRVFDREHGSTVTGANFRFIPRRSDGGWQRMEFAVRQILRYENGDW